MGEVVEVDFPNNPNPISKGRKVEKPISICSHRQANNYWLKIAKDTYFCMAMALNNPDFDEPIPVELQRKDQGRFIRELHRYLADSGYADKVKFGFSMYQHSYKNGKEMVKFNVQVLWTTEELRKREQKAR